MLTDFFVGGKTMFGVWFDFSEYFYNVEIEQTNILNAFRLGLNASIHVDEYSPKRKQGEESQRERIWQILTDKGVAMDVHEIAAELGSSKDLNLRITSTIKINQLLCMLRGECRISITGKPRKQKYRALSASESFREKIMVKILNTKQGPVDSTEILRDLVNLKLVYAEAYDENLLKNEIDILVGEGRIKVINDQTVKYVTNDKREIVGKKRGRKRGSVSIHKLPPKQKKKSILFP